MIKDYKQFDLFGKKIFEKAVVSPPFRFFYGMPDEACFYYLLRGKNKVFAPNSKVEVKASEGLVMQCGTYFCDVFADERSEYCEAIAIHLPLDVLQLIYDKEFPDFLLDVDKVRPLSNEKHKASHLLKNYIDSLQFYFDNPALVTEEILKLKVKELVLLLARTSDAVAIQKLLRRLFTKAKVSFKEVIEANIFNSFTVEELAKLTHLSLSSFKREFNKQYGTSPAKYIRERRLKKAAQLIEVTDLRLSSIAFDCGFSDLAHFSKSFHKTYGSSPRDFRLNAKAKSLD